MNAQSSDKLACRKKDRYAAEREIFFVARDSWSRHLEAPYFFRFLSHISFSSFAGIGRLFLLVWTDAPIPFSRSRKFFPRRRDEKLIGNSGGTVGSVSWIPSRIYLVRRSSAHTRARADARAHTNFVYYRSY